MPTIWPGAQLLALLSRGVLSSPYATLGVSQSDCVISPPQYRQRTALAERLLDGHLLEG